jgi:hypothetical protein
MGVRVDESGHDGTAFAVIARKLPISGGEIGLESDPRHLAVAYRHRRLLYQSQLSGSARVVGDQLTNPGEHQVPCRGARRRKGHIAGQLHALVADTDPVRAGDYSKNLILAPATKGASQQPSHTTRLNRRTSRHG